LINRSVLAGGQHTNCRVVVVRKQITDQRKVTSLSKVYKQLSSMLSYAWQLENKVTRNTTNYKTC